MGEFVWVATGCGKRNVRYRNGMAGFEKWLENDWHIPALSFSYGLFLLMLVFFFRADYLLFVASSVPPLVATFPPLSPHEC